MIRILFAVAVLLAVSVCAATNRVIVSQYIPSGTNSVVVTNFSVPVIPSNVLASVASPTRTGTGSLLLSAFPVLEGATNDSMRIDLDGITDTNNYKVTISIQW